MKPLLIYLLAVNLVASIFFISDKQRALHGRRRIPELVLHLLEALGGVFLVIPLMYIIRHKNRKISYFIITYLLFFAWIAATYFLKLHLNLF